MSKPEEFNTAMELDPISKKAMQKLAVSVAAKAVAVVPDDVTTFEATKGLYLGAAGDVSVVMADGTSVVLKALTAGVIHNISVTAVKATGTVATDIVALY